MRKSLWIAPVCMLTAAWMVAADPKPACPDAAAEAWVAALGPNVPTGYQEIEQLSRPRQRAVLRRLSDSSWSAVWLEQLARATKGGQLDERQQQVVARVQVALARGRSGARAALDSGLKLAIVGAFAPDDRRRLFGEIGPSTTESISGAGARGDSPPDCSCSAESDYCPTDHRCDAAASECIYVNGCGTFFLYTCDGTCNFVT